MSEISRSVYVIGPGEQGPVKIGQAINPHSRCLDLQTGHPYQLHVLWEAASLTAPAVEQTVHAALAHKRLSGEWFDVPLPSAVAAISDAMAGSIATDGTPWLAAPGHCPSCDKRRAGLMAAIKRRRAKR